MSQHINKIAEENQKIIKDNNPISLLSILAIDKPTNKPPMSLKKITTQQVSSQIALS